MKRQLRLGRFVLGLTLAAIVALTVGLWPNSPRWRLKGNDSTSNKLAIIGSPSNGQSLFLCERHFDPDEEELGLDVFERNAANGTELRRFSLPSYDEGFYASYLRILSDGRTLFVGFEKMERVFAPNPKRFVLIDAHTGKRFAGPFQYTGVLPLEFSNDGQWFACRTRQKSQDKMVIYSTHTGEIVQIPDRSKCEALPYVRFSSDRAMIAVMWLQDDEKAFVTLYELPSGKIRRTYELPPLDNAHWASIERWDQNKLQCMASIRSDKSLDAETNIYSMELFPDHLGIPYHEPLLDGSLKITEFFQLIESQKLGNAVVRSITENQHPEKEWKNRLFQVIDKWCGTSWAQNPVSAEHQVLIQFLNRDSGRCVFEIRAPAESYHIDSSAQWVAINIGHNELELWDTSPFPRWPLALGAGLVASFLMILLIHKVRRRSRVRRF